MQRREALAALAAPFVLPTPATPGQPRGERAIYRRTENRWVRIQWGEQKPGDGILAIDFNQNGDIHAVQVWKVEGFGENIPPEKGGPEILTKRWNNDALAMPQMMLGIW